MRLIPLGEVAKMGDKELVPSTRGKIVRVDKQVSGTGANGEWKCQKLGLEDGSAKLDIKVWGREEYQVSSKGKVLSLASGTHNKTGAMIGLTVKLETWEDKQTGEERKNLVLHASAKAEIGFVGDSEEPPDDVPMDHGSGDAPEPAKPATHAPAPATALAGGMMAKEIYYEITVNTAKFECEKIGILLSLQPGTKAKDALDAAKLFVRANAKPSIAPAP